MANSEAFEEVEVDATLNNMASTLGDIAILFDDLRSNVDAYNDTLNGNDPYEFLEAYEATGPVLDSICGELEHNIDTMIQDFNNLGDYVPGNS